VPVDTFKDEWLRRKLRNVAHLTKAGCLGPCALANVASLVFDGQAVWFHSVNTAWHVRLIYDYIETMVRADRFVAPPSELIEYVFNYYDWDVRPELSCCGVPCPRTPSGQHIALLCMPTRISRFQALAVWHCQPTCIVIGVSLGTPADRGATVAVARRCARRGARARSLTPWRARQRAWILAFARLGIERSAWLVWSAALASLGPTSPVRARWVRMSSKASARI
jgi:hypothetical protein